jgi:glutamate N-acetyltransferase/amino-acid N-acetyltransferase
MTAMLSAVWPDLPVFSDVDGDSSRLVVKGSSGEVTPVLDSIAHVPSGIRAVAGHVGIAKKADVLDFTAIKLDRPALAAAIYTRSLCPSPAVVFDRQNTRRGTIQLICVLSKNANVYTPNGRYDLEKIVDEVGKEFSVAREHVLISCTGVIGVPLPLAKIVEGVRGVSAGLSEAGLEQASHAILTTDKRPKCASIRVGELVIGGFCKGAGMIEPNMATMLVYLFTNAKLSKAELDQELKLAADRTFNAMSVDSDTSTSDTLALLSTETAETDIATFRSALSAVCCQLAQAIAREAEGATKLIEVTVGMPTSAADAMFFAKKIINSPLVKTAVHGADPNWGRLVMAIGKPSPGSPLLSIAPEEVTIAILGQTLYDRGRPVSIDVTALSQAMRQAATVDLRVDIGAPVYVAKAWGCDLSAEYVVENSAYTT